jgi:hypothetical protein
MNSAISILVVVCIIFVLTYNPQTGTLEQYFVGSSSGGPPAPVVPMGADASCCNSEDYRAENYVQCRANYYQGLQFGNPDYGCPIRQPSTCNGAIIKQQA